MPDHAATTLYTSRLLLRPLQLSDSDAIQRIFPQWDIVRFLNASVPWPYPDDGALGFVRDLALPAMAAGTEWHWSIRPRAEPQRLIGIISLRQGEDDNRGFWLAPEWQGRGLMTEACEAVTDYWFDILGETVLRVPKAVANTASRKISEREGMHLVWSGERDFVAGRLPAELWEITAEEWRQRRGGKTADDPPGKSR